MSERKLSGNQRKLLIGANQLFKLFSEKTSNEIIIFSLNSELKRLKKIIIEDRTNANDRLELMKVLAKSLCISMVRMDQFDEQLFFPTFKEIVDRLEKITWTGEYLSEVFKKYFKELKELQDVSIWDHT